MSCLHIKLGGTVKNKSVPILGTFLFHVTTENADPTATCNSLTINASKSIQLTILGDGHFTDSSFTSDLGKIATVAKDTNTILYFSKGNYDVLCDARYLLKYLSNAGAGGALGANNRANIWLNLNDLKYASAITSLYLSYSRAKGDIGFIGDATGVTAINLSYTDITGDIDGIKDLTLLTSLNLSNTNVYGDIASISDATALTAFNISNTKVAGDIGALENVPLVGSVYIQGLDNLYGDLAKLSKLLCFISNANGSSEFIWEASRPAGSYFMALERIRLGNYVDSMLNAQADLDFYSSVSDSTPWLKTLRIYGTRTSASDAAVATLKSRGVIINLNDVII